MVTLKTIADEAGVSTVTVSNVIRKKYSKVSPEKVELINEIIKKYNYVPNANARSLASKKSNIIGIIIPYVGDNDNFLSSPYNMEIFGVLEREIRKRGYFAMIRTVSTVAEATPIMKSWNVDGAIILGANASDVEFIKAELSFPMVFVDSYSSCPHVNVGVDDENGGYLATRFLINNGHRKIWFVGPEVDAAIDSVIQQRYKGYIRALEESNIEQEKRWMFAHSTNYECGINVGKAIAFEKERPTAVFATSDIVALGIIEGLRLSGLSVPDEISVMGFDNLPEGQYAYPKLTSISQNIPIKGHMVANALFEVIDSQTENAIDLSSFNRGEKIQVDLVERNSVKNIAIL